VQAVFERQLADALSLVETLRARLADRDRLLAERDAQVERLAARVGELERRLGLDSSNSSKPPSSDGLGKKPAPARPREKGARKPGKQRGTPGTHRAMIDDPDRVVEHIPACCKGCGAGLDDAPVTGYQRRQVVEVPPVRPETVEHRAQTRRCGCGKTTTAAFPAEATAPVCFGPRVQALVVYLTDGHFLPVARAAQTLLEVFGLRVATGTVAKIRVRTAGLLAAFTAELAARLTAEPVVHFDETGVRVEGRLHWLHVASTRLLTFYFAHTARGGDAIDEMGVLPAFTGTAVRDCWAPYDNYPNAAHALCGAHVLRDLNAAAELDGQDWASRMAGLLIEAHRRTILARAAGHTRLAPDILASIRARYDGYVQQALAVNPARRHPDGRKAARGPAGALADRLAARRDDYLRFTIDFAVPFDNNQAERDIRIVKTQQKVSGGWRSLERGASVFCVIRGYLSTLHKHDQPLLETLHTTFATRRCWIPPPTAAPVTAAPAAA
jgi:transposase